MGRGGPQNQVVYSPHHYNPSDFNAEAATAEAVNRALAASSSSAGDTAMSGVVSAGSGNGASAAGGLGAGPVSSSSGSGGSSGVPAPGQQPGPGCGRAGASTGIVGPNQSGSAVPQQQAATAGTSGPMNLSSSAGTSNNQDLASLFECPVCFDYVLPPILQCQAGHLVCSSCRPKLTCCPTCRGQLGANIRNLAMEKVASTVMFPCRYQQSGCGASLLHTEKTDHEETCEYRPYQCPCPGASCKWQGALEHVMSHLMQVHKSITTLQGEDIVFLATDINLPGAVDWVMMQSCFGHHFMLVLEKQEKFDGHQQFFAIVQLIGTRKQAENFAYRLELNGHRRRLTWEATPRSIHEGVSSAIMNSDCLVFDTSIAQLFADNGNLGINVTISMC